MLRVMVLNYKRPANVNKIIAAYKNKFPITVINNNPSDPFPVMGTNIDVINNDTNYKCMERWIRCYEYDEPYKLVLDDDLLPSIDTIKRMYKKMNLWSVYMVSLVYLKLYVMQILWITGA
jgi:hypothetical protein